MEIRTRYEDFLCRDCLNLLLIRAEVFLEIPGTYLVKSNSSHIPSLRFNKLQLKSNLTWESTYLFSQALAGHG